MAGRVRSHEEVRSSAQRHMKVVNRGPSRQAGGDHPSQEPSGTVYVYQRDLPSTDDLRQPEPAIDTPRWKRHHVRKGLRPRPVTPEGKEQSLNISAPQVSGKGALVGKCH